MTEHIRSIAFPLPPLPEQQRIVGILDGTLRGIAIAKSNAARKLASLEELKKSVLRQAFRGEL